MRVLCAPDGFAGTLGAPQVAAALMAGWAEARPEDELSRCPLADGGPGTVDVVAAAHPDARVREVEVADARGRARRARWLLLPDGRALVESAQACGLDHLEPHLRDPLDTTTYGVGQLLRAAAAGGAREIVVGLGGSATVDGGAGLALALGGRLVRADGNGLKVGARALGDLVRVDPPERPADAPTIVAAADVDNPLLGPDGAVAVFAPQKGASPADLPLLEHGLTVWADAMESACGGRWRDLAGAGAAGGLGFGLAALLGASLRPGAALVADLVGFADALASADLVVTGEGALDATTVRGKVPSFVAAAARARGVPVLAVAGEIRDRAGAAFDDAEALGSEGLVDPATAVRAAAARLAKRVGVGAR